MSVRPWVLGISASHNGAVCLLHGDEIVVAVQEERLTRRKRARIYGAAPSLALQYCLDFARISPGDLDMIVLAAQGHLSSEEHDIRRHPVLDVERHRTRVLTVSHHLAHGVSAFATSGFEESAVLVVDGIGSPVDDLGVDEQAVLLGPGLWETISLYAASGTNLVPIEKHVCQKGEFERPADRVGMPYPRSLGGIFSAASMQIFGNATEAGKVMGLAPYGTPEIPVDEFFRLVGSRFEFRNEAADRFDFSERWPSHPIEYQILAASCQVALEVALLELCGRLRGRLGPTNFCFAGGVALNSVANERIARESGFRQHFFFPAAEDSGAAVGAAYFGLWQMWEKNTRKKLERDAFGCTYSFGDVDAAAKSSPAVDVEPRDDTIRCAVDLLCNGKIIGWFDGASELGPRALGQRSILCDPRSPFAKEQLNARVKHRESFRPFAPAVLKEELGNWFETVAGEESPFMMRVLPFLPGMAERVPAVSHVDGTGRVQTLTVVNGRFFELVSAFHKRTGVPIVLNTSFNIMGEPIVETPHEALWALLYTDLDAVVFPNHVVTKRPGFRSILDLYPLVRDVRITDDVARAGNLPGDDGPDLVITTQTQWGATESRYPAAVGKVLREIDGRSSGWQLLGRLSTRQETEISEKQLVRLLGMLRRQFILDFSGSPAAVAG